VRFLGALRDSWGMAGARVLKSTPAWKRTEKFRVLGHLAPKREENAVTAEGCCLPCPSPLGRTAVGSCCRNRSGLSFCLPGVRAQHQPSRTAFGSSEISKGSSLQLAKGFGFFPRFLLPFTL